MRNEKERNRKKRIKERKKKKERKKGKHNKREMKDIYQDVGVGLPSRQSAIGRHPIPWRRIFRVPLSHGIKNLVYKCFETSLYWKVLINLFDGQLNAIIFDQMSPKKMS